MIIHENSWKQPEDATLAREPKIKFVEYKCISHVREEMRDML